MTKYLKVLFTDMEIAAKAQELARANRQRSSIEQEKKEIDTSLKSKIEEQNSLIKRLSDEITAGSEYRNVEVTVILDTPVSGKKTVRRLDTNEDVAIETMTDQDRQLGLDLEAKADAETVHQMPSAPVLQLPAPDFEGGTRVALSDGTKQNGTPLTPPIDVQQVAPAATVTRGKTPGRMGRAAAAKLKREQELAALEKAAEPEGAPDIADDDAPWETEDADDE